MRVLSGKWVRTGDPRPVAHCDNQGSARAVLNAIAFFLPLDASPRRAQVAIPTLDRMPSHESLARPDESINDKAANIAAARAWIERAVAEELPDWVLLPEQFDWAGGVKGKGA